MFNPQALAKDSPMAHVWLASTLDRKLSKNNYIRTNIVDVVEEIKEGQGTAGSSLRLSGQLLLGVSTVYQRQTLYLKEDCDSALQSLRTFKPGNVDTTSSNIAKSSSLVLQNQITELNISNLIPEFPALEFDDFSMTQMPFDAAPEGEMSIAANDSIEIGRGGIMRDVDEDIAGDEDDLGLDFEADDDEEMGDKSVELGLERPPARAVGDDLGLGFDDSILGNKELDRDQDLDVDMNMDVDVDLDIDFAVDASDNEAVNAPTSPGAEPAVAAGEEEENGESEEAAPRRRRQVIKKGKVTQYDSQLVQDTRQTQQEIDTTHVLPPLPQNNEAFVIYQLQNKNTYINLLYGPIGHFPKAVSQLFDPVNALRLINAPKRGTQAADGGAENDELDEDVANKHPRTEEDLPEGEHQFENSDIDMDIGIDMDAARDDDSVAGDDNGEETHGYNSVPELVQEEPVLFAVDENESSVVGTGISRNTIQAARILRKEMPAANETASFDLLSGGSNRPDKVKMFFEMLVLATKDAITVSQDVPFEDIVIRSKEGLYSEVLTA